MNYPFINSLSIYKYLYRIYMKQILKINQATRCLFGVDYYL